MASQWATDARTLKHDQDCPQLEQQSQRRVHDSSVFNDPADRCDAVRCADHDQDVTGLDDVRRAG